jgi:hypothetical protein
MVHHLSVPQGTIAGMTSIGERTGLDWPEGREPLVLSVDCAACPATYERGGEARHIRVHEPRQGHTVAERQLAYCDGLLGDPADEAAPTRSAVVSHNRPAMTGSRPDLP